MNALTKEESLLLETCETAIETGIDSFLEVGNALARIRDGKLYRETHGTFADYVRERWNMSSSYAYRIMNMNEVVEDLLPIGDIPNEAQSRELGKLETPAERAEVWQEVIEETQGKPTAKAVKEAVEKRQIDTAETSRPQQSTSFDDDTCDLEDFIQRLQDCIDEEWQAGQLGRSQIVDGVYKAAVYAKGLK